MSSRYCIFCRERPAVSKKWRVCAECYEAFFVVRARQKNASRARSRELRDAGEVKPQPCVDCGAPKSEMHHPDYRHPEQVVWLCRPCHALRHADENNEWVDGWIRFYADAGLSVQQMIGATGLARVPSARIRTRIARLGLVVPDRRRRGTKTDARWDHWWNAKEDRDRQLGPEDKEKAFLGELVGRMTQTEIGRVLGCDAATVGRRLRHYGIAARPRGKRELLGRKLTITDVTEIRAKASAGTLTRELALEYGVSRQTISSILNLKSWKERK